MPPNMRRRKDQRARDLGPDILDALDSGETFIYPLSRRLRQPENIVVESINQLQRQGLVDYRFDRGKRVVRRTSTK